MARSRRFWGRLAACWDAEQRVIRESDHVLNGTDPLAAAQTQERCKSRAARDGKLVETRA